MSGHWKGTKVYIEIYKANEWAEAAHEGDYYLDTDTLSTLFDKYPPSDYRYDITPAWDEDDEDYDSNCVEEYDIVFH